MSKILPDILLEHVDSQTSALLTFYQGWVAAGCQSHWQGQVIDEQYRFLVKTELDRDNYLQAVLYIEQRTYNAFRHTQQWNWPKPFGGINRHPTVWIAEITRGLLDSLAIGEMQAP